MRGSDNLLPKVNPELWRNKKAQAIIRYFVEQQIDENEQRHRRKR